MPNGILTSNNNATTNNIKQNLYAHHNDRSQLNGTLKKQNEKSVKQDEVEQQQTGTILNVAEMLLHGVADHEILEIWLRSIACQEYVKNFLDAGYDMPTISRVTPQDLTAIGITDPSKRSKIISEIKKLNLQDGIPSFKPASLSHWLALLHLDSNYYKSLCDQNIDTIDKVCQLTWEDFEELGINKLGHQKRLQIAMERIRDLGNAESKASKPISEPIYDTNASQILLVASTENHSMNGPIINKQSSTSELSSTGSGSMHSIYSASSHHQPNHHAAHHSNNNYNNSADTNGRPMQTQSQQQQQQAQAIYSQAPPQLFHNQQQQQQQTNQTSQPQTLLTHHPPPLPPPNLMQQQLNGNMTPNQQTISQAQIYPHYQPAQSQFSNPSLSDDKLKWSPMFGNSGVINNSVSHQQYQHSQTNRQSLGQLPFVLANLPAHQQQLLQQSSIYATLSRQPQRIKQPPPPVPIRTNSLKSNSLIDEEDNRQRNEQLLKPSFNDNLGSPQRQQVLSGSPHSTVSANSPFRTGSRTSNRGSLNSHMLQKNKSFSGSAYMDAARARFMNRNNSQPHQQLQIQQQPIYSTSNLTQNIRNLTNGFAISHLNQNITTANQQKPHQDIYGVHTMLAATLQTNSGMLCNGKLTCAPPNQTTTAGDGESLNRATIGRDDDFPPPPSPLSINDFDAQTITESA